MADFSLTLDHHYGQAAQEETFFVTSKTTFDSPPNQSLLLWKEEDGGRPFFVSFSMKSKHGTLAKYLGCKAHMAGILCLTWIFVRKTCFCSNLWSLSDPATGRSTTRLGRWGAGSLGSLLSSTRVINSLYWFHPWDDQGQNSRIGIALQRACLIFRVTRNEHFEPFYSINWHFLRLFGLFH